jgi:glutathione synthase/RimK-type ligase-like ATP-grasp enzyme
VLDVALVDCRHLSFDDGDRGPLLEALTARGVRADWWSWDDGALDWSTTRAAVVRMTWDYSERLEDFLGWVDRAEMATELLNPAGVLRWNVHKSYLLDLEAAGVPIVPTLLVPASEWDLLDARLAATAWTEVVVKPAVGAGARGAFRSPAASLVATAPAPARDVLVQPLVETIASEGETSLVYVGGAYSHAVRKRPAEGDYRVQEEHGGGQAPVDPTDPQLAVAQRALEAVPGDLLYARVDLVTGSETGDPQVMEVEVVEPSLYLSSAPGSTDRFAAAIAARIPALD